MKATWCSALDSGARQQLGPDRVDGRVVGAIGAIGTEPEHPILPLG